MNRCPDNARMTMSILLGVVLVEVAAFAGIAPPQTVDPNTMVRLNPREFWQLPGWEDRLAQEKYQKEGAEVVPWSQETALPGPDNAALLYYQACLLRPQPDEATFLRISDVLGGAQPDASVRSYLGHCRKMIHTVEIASQVPQCTWGIHHFDAEGFRETDLLGQIRQLALVLALDARTLGADRHYDAAFARCLTMRRMAHHVGNDTMFAYLVSRTIDEIANHTMQHVLGHTPPNADLLRQLRGQLAAIPGMPRSYEEAVQADFEQSIGHLRRNHHTLEWIRQQIGKTEDTRKAQTLGMMDDEILAQARKACLLSLNSVFQVLDSDMPYERKYIEIDRRIQAFDEQHSDDPAAHTLWSLASGRMAERHNLFVRNTAAFNALKSALEIYLVKAQTGRLPETLPAYTPKDPFSGQEFEYEITASGFILRCRAKDLYENRIWQYEFKVRE